MKDVTVRKGFGTTPTTPETTALTYLIRDIGNHGVGSPQVTMTLAQRAADLFEDGGWQRCYLNPAPTSPVEFVRKHLRVEPAELVAAMSETRAAATRAPTSTSLWGGVSEEDQRRVQAMLCFALITEPDQVELLSTTALGDLTRAVADIRTANDERYRCGLEPRPIAARAAGVLIAGGDQIALGDMWDAAESATERLDLLAWALSAEEAVAAARRAGVDFAAIREALFAEAYEES